MKLSNNLRLLIVWLVLSLLILTNSYYFASGYLSPDSTYYLQLVRNLLHGQGFMVPDFTYHDGFIHFANWPLGYPFAIYLTAKVFHLDVFWASKLLNIILLGFSFLILKKWFREKAWMFSLIYLVDTFIKINTYTWSEGLFLFFLLWYMYALWNYWNFPEKNRYLLQLFISMLLLFITRYIGFIFIVPVLIFAFTLFRRKRYSQAFWLTGICIMASIFIFCYFYYNYSTTSYITGYPRPESTTIILPFVQGFLIGVAQEIIPISLFSSYSGFLSLPTIFKVLIILVLVVFALALYFVSQKSINWKSQKNYRFFFLPALVYLVFIIVFKYFSTIDSFNFRILGPSTFLFYLTFGLYFSKCKINYSKFLKKYFIPIVIFILFYYSPPVKAFVYSGNIQAVFNNNYSYNRYKTLVKDYYKIIPPNSVVAFSNYHINYLLSDKYFAETRLEKGNHKETIDEMIGRLNNNNNIDHAYIEIRSDLKPGRYHPSIYQFMKVHEGEKFYQIK